MAEKIIAEKVGWSKFAEEDFAKPGVVIDEKSIVSKDYYRRQVEAEELLLIRYRTETKHIGHVAVRSEDIDGVRELVIVAGSGALKGVNLVKTLVPLLCQFGKDNGATSVRIHTNRKGLERKLAGIGFEKVETVLRYSL